MELLIKKDELDEFYIEFDDNQDFEAYASFKVLQVISWGVDNKPIDMEGYLKGTIKWDGCSHIWFGDDDGYMHLCGKSYFDSHNKVMDAIWDVCSKKIKRFDSDIAS